MKVRSAAADRRLWVTLDGGSLIDALAELAAERDVGTGWVRGVGALRSAELEGAGELGEATLLSLEGSLGPQGRLFASVAIEDGTVVGGRLRDAEVASVELWIERFEPEAQPSARWTSEPEEDADDTGPSWADVAAASAEKAIDDNARVSWADVAAASAEPEPPAPPPRSKGRARSLRSPRARSQDLEVVPQKGDFIQHRQFGLCKVQGPSKGGGIVVKLPSGIRKTIRLDYMDVGHPRDEGGRRVFPVRPKKR